MIERGARVVVSEPGIAPWTGTVTAVKPGNALSLTREWIEIRRDDGRSWNVPVELVELDPDNLARLDSTTPIGNAIVQGTRKER